MKVGILCHASFGGSARVATELALALAHRGHQVHLFSRTPPFDVKVYADKIIMHNLIPKREQSHHPATLHTDWSAEELQALLSCILDVIDTEGLDIFHFHYADPFALIAAAIKQRLGPLAPRLVGTIHGTDVIIQGRDPHKGPQLAQALQAVDDLTTVSVSLAHLAADVFTLPVYPRVIPNFVDLSRFRPESPEQKERSRLGDNFHWPKIIHISNFRPIKNPQSMAHLFLEIRKQIKAQLWLIGAGKELDEVKAILRQGKVEEDVRYWGLQPNVVPLLAQADLLVMTSQYESFCLAALEAMACGVPVLATRVGGLPEVVRHEETGYLFPIGDHTSAAAWAVSLLSDPVRYDMMRQAAIDHAHHYRTEQIVPNYESLYQGLLNNGDGANGHNFSLKGGLSTTIPYYPNDMSLAYPIKHTNPTN